MSFCYLVVVVGRWSGDITSLMENGGECELACVYVDLLFII